MDRLAPVVAMDPMVLVEELAATQVELAAVSAVVAMDKVGSVVLPTRAVETLSGLHSTMIPQAVAAMTVVILKADLAEVRTPTVELAVAVAILAEVQADGVILIPAGEVEVTTPEAILWPRPITTAVLAQ